MIYRFLAIFALLMLLVGCSSNAVSTTARIQAETAQISRIDTVIVHTASEAKDRIDSVIITKTDTVQVVKYYGVAKDRWVTRDSIVIRRDTIYLQRTDSVFVEKEIPAKSGLRDILAEYFFVMATAFVLGVLLLKFIKSIKGRLWL